MLIRAAIHLQACYKGSSKTKLRGHDLRVKQFSLTFISISKLC